jgi:hypothetical protein
MAPNQSCVLGKAMIDMNPYLVFGTGRSGTSFVAGVLHNHLGITMGSEFPKFDGCNPDGFWEDLDFYNLNKQFRFHGLPFSDFVTNLRILFKQKSSVGKLWGIKESRLAYCLGIYLALIDDPKLIWCTRDRNLVIKSSMGWHRWSRQEAEITHDNRYMMIRNVLKGKDYLKIHFTDDKKSKEEVASAVVEKFKELQ